MIFSSKKLIFVHVPKTGGKLIRRLFRACRGLGPNTNRLLGMHFSLRQVPQKYPEVDIREYSVLVVKRPPWERLASLYVDNHKNADVGKVINRPDPDPATQYTKVKYNDDFMNLIEIDGEPPRNLFALDFHNLEYELRKFFTEELDTELDAFIPMIGANPEPQYVEMYQKTLQDRRFLDFITENSQREIEYFGYDIP